MTTTVVRYTVTPDRAEENAALVRAVYAELASAAPEGFRYTTSVLADGVTFVHVAIHGDAGEPLTGLAAFKAFQAGLRERCAVPPDLVRGEEVIGAYGF